jgi:BirA family transcriptional regulator, biotin operon repressor / biotin---[acetyl-CoA-carboxylase] ligase
LSESSSSSYFERFRRQMDLMQFETLPLFSRPLLSWNLHTDHTGRRFIYRPSTESTQDDARRMLERWRIGSGTIMLAETQTAGRGRGGRSWVSPPDVNLHFTLVEFTGAGGMRPLAFVTPLAIAQAIEEVAAGYEAALRPDLKWPNDVLIDGRKVAGVLIEAATGPEGEDVALVGVGINVNLDAGEFPEIENVATSVRQALGMDVHRELVLAAFCNRFESLYEEAKSGSRAPFLAWRARLVTLGREVVATTGREAITGLAVDVNDSGGLVIQVADGSSRVVDAGDVTLGGR